MFTVDVRQPNHARQTLSSPSLQRRFRLSTKHRPNWHLCISSIPKHAVTTAQSSPTPNKHSMHNKSSLVHSTGRNSSSQSTILAVPTRSRSIVSPGYIPRVQNQQRLMPPTFSSWRRSRPHSFVWVNASINSLLPLPITSTTLSSASRPLKVSKDMSQSYMS